MNNDLISREALKKALKEYKYCGFYDKVIEIIDNAPTVEERPKGKWINVPCERDLVFNKGIKYTCSVCGKFNSYGHSAYCPNCGAKMKGGAE